ncbi:hypothetical protein [Stigmatella aurantiaca]|uniref:Conserved uncharacterized protein n=1 Tax=Stigmatella aurantiaca (strain DW4/3-1) TaxID=378806 RepID=Q09CL9_STIAD|nr:hypothetical protein [Stigmatella aurantiaca]ADO70030.1 conserved uncharacterized protein [Stigmatella aurantiaca DW4/3-1]EAU69564.1 hypothetical protein STIAU_2109 [Stigmatella aurantiaca DW4/3-1]
MKRLVALVGGLVAFAAGAYVLPGGSIMRRTVSAREDASIANLRVEGSYVFFGPAAKEAGTALGVSTERSELAADGLILLKPPERCRFELGAQDGNRLAVVQAGDRRRQEGPELAVLSAAMSQLCPLLTARSGADGDARAQLEQHLQELGIATRTTSLARFGGEVAYVLGDPGDTKPQFWVYKDNFRPARVRWSDKAGTAWDVRFIDYASAATGGALPRSIEVWRGGQRALRFTAIRSDARAVLAEKLFTP